MILVAVMGWTGMVLVIWAYALLSGEVISNGPIFHTMNLAGAVLLGVQLYINRVWPPFVLQVAWGTIAIGALLKGGGVI